MESFRHQDSRNAAAVNSRHCREHQIGLYQGANMGLLKTVFEVNLGLFGGGVDNTKPKYVDSSGDLIHAQRVGDSG